METLPGGSEHGRPLMRLSRREWPLITLWNIQVFLVITFWVWRILHGNPGGPRLLWLRRANRLLRE